MTRVSVVSLDYIIGIIGYLRCERVPECKGMVL